MIFINKLIFRGKNSETRLDSHSKPNGTRANADMLVAYSTLPGKDVQYVRKNKIVYNNICFVFQGFYSCRDPKEGTWYIQGICKVFKEHAKTHHVEDLLKIVDEELTRKNELWHQTSIFENRGFKTCYLNPK